MHHWLLSKLSRDLSEGYQRIQDEIRGNPSNIQLSGYLAENVWKRLIAQWLPPSYELKARRHIVYEQAVDGAVRSPEVDLVLLHPSYPERLQDEQEVLVSGVVVALSVKLTLTPEGLREAIEMAIRLRRGMKVRVGEPIGDLVSPLVTGVLAQSYRGFGSDPEGAVDQILLDAARRLDGSDCSVDDADYVSRGLASHPRNELDFVCIADLNCWRRRPMVMWQDVDAPRRQGAGVFTAPWLSGKKLSERNGRLAEPVAIFISELWQKLAYRDHALKPIADGFRMTDTPGSGAGHNEPKPLKPLVHSGTYAVLQGRRFVAVDG